MCEVAHRLLFYTPNEENYNRKSLSKSFLILIGYCQLSRRPRAIAKDWEDMKQRKDFVISMYMP